ncbi:MAG: hypothetical protein JXL20_05460 [Deltaproteobacteria bacterium]|nr:hypothetical protein [Deltaproteobacteria bacterium]
MKVNIKVDLRLRVMTKIVPIVIAAALLLWGGGLLGDAQAAVSSAEAGAMVDLRKKTDEASGTDKTNWIGTVGAESSYHSHPPDRPSLYFPAYGATDICPTTTLQTWPFHDYDQGDTHQKTDWEISKNNNFSSTVLDITSDTHLTSLPIPQFTLLPGTTYWWRAQFYDSSGNASGWSSASSFTTKTATNDLNGNGIPDELENNTVDLDHDGIPDIQQTDIKSLNTRVGNGQMGVSCRNATNVNSIDSIDSIDPATISDVSRPYGMPLGLLPMRLSVKNAGDTVQVVVYFSQAADPNAKWLKYDRVNGWKDYSAHATFSTDRKSVTLTLTDGGEGDADEIANGTIIDPGGFGLASWVEGLITSASTGLGVSRAEVTVGDLTFYTDLNGNYLCMLLPGDHTFSVSATGYITLKTSSNIPEAQTVTLNLGMTPSSQSYSLYFPHSATAWGWETEIAAINTSDTQATCTLNGYNDQGALVEAMPITLPPHGRSEIKISQGFTNHSAIGYLILNSTIGAIKGYTKFYQQGQYRVAIPAVSYKNTSDIFIPHIALDAAWWTGISLVNTTSDTKNLTITFNNGETGQITLAANGQEVINIGAQYFNNQPRTDIQSAVISNAGGVIGLELFGSLGWGTQLEGILLTDRTAQTLYYPHVPTASEGWWTGIVAYNTSTSDCTITITPYKENGAAILPSLPHTIGNKGKFIRPTPTEPLGLPDQTAWFKIVSTRPLSGFELFGSADGQRLGSYAGGGETGRTEGIFPKIEKDGWTGIAFVNTESTAATVTLTAYDDDGAPVGIEVLSVPGYAKEVKITAAFFTQDISRATYIAFSSDKRVVGFQLNNSTDNRMLDGLPGM